jgi:hypothetical protein
MAAGLGAGFLWRVGAGQLFRVWMEYPSVRGGGMLSCELLMAHQAQR